MQGINKGEIILKKLAFFLLSSLLGISSICITGCNNNKDINKSDIYFPVAEYAMNDYPVDLTQGTLIFDGKYLLIRSGFLFFGTDTLAIWPYGYSVNVEDGEIQVLDESSQVVAHVGDSIKVGGGETTKEVVEENYIGESLPDDCEGPYWLVSEVVDD